MFRSIRVSAAMGLLGSLVLAGCSTSRPTTTSTPDPLPTTASSQPSLKPSFPLTITNCGRQLRFDRAPQRTVALSQASAETLLSLGLEAQVAGTAGWTDDVLTPVAKVNKTVPRISRETPKMPAVLAKKPDLVTASFTEALTEERAGSPSQYAARKVPSYISPTGCAAGGDPNDSSAKGARKTKFQMKEVYQEINDLARIHGVPQRGADLVTDLDKRLASVVKASPSRKPTVVFWFSGIEEPRVAGGTGTAQFVSDHLGLTNMYADRKEQWAEVTWEDVARKNPDIIVIASLDRKDEPAEYAPGKISTLVKNPTTATMKAVKQEQYITVQGVELSPSLRTVDLAEKMSTGLFQLGLVH
ncbi:ABC transporter substrate-binding protein [Luteococcus sp. H138]|uniref:ABC transporter substrate-binding protein n=1 Tax=unclassified Luteococcus TaxID=2639923 RepID=UPI00313EDCF1